MRLVRVGRDRSRSVDTGRIYVCFILTFPAELNPVGQNNRYFQKLYDHPYNTIWQGKQQPFLFRVGDMLISQPVSHLRPMGDTEKPTGTKLRPFSYSVNAVMRFQKKRKSKTPASLIFNVPGIRFSECMVFSYARHSCQCFSWEIHLSYWLRLSSTSSPSGFGICSIRKFSSASLD